MRKLLTLLTVFVFYASGVMAQTTITGKIVDQQSQPISYASIAIKGTKGGTVADADGNFTLKTSVSKPTLVITGAGINSTEYTVGDNTRLLVIPVSNKANSLTEVLVTTAFGVRRQPKELGYATARISADELTQAKVVNVTTGLAAKVSGLQVNLVNNGVKADTRVTLRGNRSILGNNQALLVVDDIQLPISYAGTISPNDIENVTILKGASGSALYGSAASNGVIIITTKKGTRGRPRISLSSTTQLETIAYMPKFQNEFGQYGGENDPNAYPGIVFLPSDPYVPYVPYENQNYGPRYNGQKVPLGPPIRIYNADGSFKIAQDSGTYSAIPNAKRDFFDKGVTTQNSISYSTGDEHSRFYFSFEDVNIHGVVPKDVNRRNSFRLNGSRETGIFRVDYNLGYSLSHSNTTPGSGVPFKWGTTGYGGGYVGGGSYFQSRPLYWTIINTPANIDLRKYRDWQHNPFASPDGYFNAYYGNPWWQIDQTRLDEKNSDLLANVALNLKPTNWLNLQYRAGIARDDYNNKYTQAGYTFAPWAIADTLGSGNIPSGVKKLSPSVGDGISYNQRVTSDFLASVHKSYGDFDAKLIGGTSLIVNTIRLFSASASALVIPDFYNISNRLGNPTTSEYKEEVRTLGVFGDLTLGWRNMLFVHGSLRNDWTSLLSKSNRSYLYPDIDASFVFTDAIGALKNNKVLTYGKIRAAYSRTAQVSIGAYQLQNIFNTGAGFPFGNVPGFSVSGAFANPDIKPEISTDKEVGLDLGFLENRITFGASLYKTITDNQTIPVNISSTTGFTTAYVNSGKMLNEGIELDLRFIPIQTKNVRWEVNANYSYNKNELLSLGFGLNSLPLSGAAGVANFLLSSPATTTNAIVGQPYPAIKATDWKRDPQGRIVVDATTGYPSLDNNPKVFGTSNPPTKIGLGTSVTFKGLTLSAVVDGRFGAQIFNSIGPNLDFTGVSAYSASQGRQPFVIPNSSYFDANSKNYVANTNINTQDGNNLFWANVWNTAGSNYVNSADFWKLRELALSYSFPKTLLAKQKVINALNVGVSARNLLTWRAKDNIWSDPEFANNTGNATGATDINQLPPTRIYGFNVTVTF